MSLDRGEKRLEKVEEVLSFYGCDGVEEKISKIGEYIRLVLKWRKWGQLTSASDMDSMETTVCESLGILSVLDHEGNLVVADLGSGGGILGIPLGIACEKWGINLLESSSRKCAFLAEVVGVLELENVSIKFARVEGTGSVGAYPIVISRAFGKFKEIIPEVFAILEGGGIYVTLKGTDAEKEIRESMSEIMRYGFEFEKIVTPSHFEKLGEEPSCSLVLLRKL